MRPSLRMPTLRRSLISSVVAVSLVALAVFTYRELRWKRFHVVTPSVLYRSGSLTSHQLQQAIAGYGLRSVFSLTFTRNADEARVCEQAGTKRFFHYLPGDGVGPDEPYLAFLKAIDDPKNRPMLVHCSAGVQRTGGCVLLYRVLHEGWSFDDAYREMIAIGNDGNEPQREQLLRLINRLKSVRESSIQMANRPVVRLHEQPREGTQNLVHCGCRGRLLCDFRSRAQRSSAESGAETFARC